MSECMFGPKPAESIDQDKTESLANFLDLLISKLGEKYPELTGLSYATNTELHSSIGLATLKYVNNDEIAMVGVEFSQTFARLDEIRDLQSFLPSALENTSGLLGIDVVNSGEKAKIMQAYYLLHEVGHLKDFLNFKQSMGSSEKAYKYMSEECTQSSKENLVLGLTFEDISSITQGDFTKLQEQCPRFFEENQIESSSDLLLLAGMKICNAPQEKRADKFVLENMGLVFPNLQLDEGIVDDSK